MARGDHADTVRTLIADFNLSVSRLQDALGIAVNFETVRALIDGGADIEGRSMDDLTPLHAAAWGGHASAVYALVASGADINAKTDDYFQTPLERAATSGDAETVQALLAAGVKVTSRAANLARVCGHNDLA